MRTIVLYPYQYLDVDELIGFYRAGSPHVALLYCTGAGKTVTSLSLVARLMGDAWIPFNPRITHTLVAAPTLIIKEAFDQACVCDRDRAYSTPIVEDLGGLDDWQQFLAYPTYDHIKRTTHVRLSQLVEYIKEDIARNKLLVIDEAHHTGEGKSFTAFRDAWLAAGGLVLSLTATPERADDLQAIPDDVPRRARSMTSQMEAKLAPERLQSDIVLVAGEATTDKDTAMQPLDPNEVGLSMSCHWVRDHKPKSILRLKGIGEASKHRRMLLALARSVRAQGGRVFVASETHQKDPELDAMNREVLDFVRSKTGYIGAGDINEILSYEDSLSRYEESSVDVILGMQSVLEGLNWQICSHTYFVGVPMHLLALVQGIGRAMRNRRSFETYPETWRLDSKVVMLASAETHLAEEAHKKQMLVVACYLSTFRQWSLLGALSKVFKRLNVSGSAEDEELLRREVERFQIPEGKMARIREAILETERIFARAHKLSEPRLVGLARSVKLYLERCVPDWGDITLEEIRLTLLMQRADGKELLGHEVERRMTEGATLTNATLAAIETVLHQFNDRVRTPTESDRLTQEVLQSLVYDAEGMKRAGEVVRVQLEPSQERSLDAYSLAARRLRQ